jgi:hypothetical protein
MAFQLRPRQWRPSVHSGFAQNSGETTSLGQGLRVAVVPILGSWHELIRGIRPVISGTNDSWTQSRFGPAISTSGAGVTNQLAYTSTMDSPPGDFSCAALVFLPAGSAGNSIQMFGNYAFASNQRSWSISTNANSWKFYVSDAGTSFSNTAISTTGRTDEWLVVVGRYKSRSGEIECFMSDGTVATPVSSGFLGGVHKSTADLTINGFVSSWGAAFEIGAGYLWHRQISRQEIGQLFADPLAPLRRRPRQAFVSSVSGRVMGGLAGTGGLAGAGGLAGSIGGLS